MPLIPSLRRALSRLLGQDGGHGTPGDPPAAPRTTSSATSLPRPSLPAPGTLIAVGDHVVFATSPREAERALLLMMEGAGDDLRRACGRALQAVRGGTEEAAA